ncbi:MAG: tetratricopeptide repeat protein [marine benthic group bacterium]|jgi:tetratricopeptide (TPR) repeat protein|nr:tetratricopeptide repeat protein [Gemmatimonadota bacterium]MCL7962747.1 tetratricopeptide repeat protein [Candidatus Carthagonibacter metallireducens]MCL7964797.1 tetratricopeptide repeat protein [Gemmatimonadota bacterium]MCL7968931.1 tetratricopeptide repeat protein [Gemmatimonadota bacterium]MCL7978968.1 tetratricopeptide repeat protein [Gemmatimonadota bacterium]
MNRVAGITVRLALSFAAALAVSLTQAELAVAQEGNGGSGGRARVLVAPLKSGNGVKKDFGKKVSEEVQDDLRDFPTLTTIEEKVIDDELKRLKLDKDDLGLIQWRQLAGRLDADLVMYGEVARGGAGNTLNVSFVDARSGDELAVPPFAVAGDGKDEVREAADVIVEAFEGQVEYQRAVLFCQDYLSAEQYEDAIRNCDEALARNPGSSTAHYLRGRAYMEIEDFESARSDLETVIEENPAEVLALQSLAYTEAKLGNTQRATELYREYLNFNPGDASVRMTIAYDLAQAGAYDPAIALLEEGLEVDPENAELWEYLGNVSLNKGTASDTEAGDAAITDEAAVRRAAESYDRVLEIKGEETSPEILRNVIAAHLALGDYEQALAFADRAQASRPDDPAIWSMRADVLNKMDRPAEAAAAMDRVIELDPAYPNAHARRGFFKLAAGDTDAAIADLRLAVGEGTDADAVAGQMLSRGYNDFFKAGQYGDAIQMFKVGTEFAQPGRTRDQLYFFTAYGYYQQGVAIDAANESAEACDPARRALSNFEQVLPNLNRAGNEQPNAQTEIRESTDVYLYRQQQIIKKACK